MQKDLKKKKKFKLSAVFSPLYHVWNAEAVHAHFRSFPINLMSAAQQTSMNGDLMEINSTDGGSILDKLF